MQYHYNECINYYNHRNHADARPTCEMLIYNILNKLNHTNQTYH